MEIPSNMKSIIKEWLNNEVEKKIKEVPIRIIIKDREVDFDSISYDGGEIIIQIQNNLYSYDTTEWADINFYQEEKE